MQVPKPLLLSPMQAALAPKESLERLFQVTAFAVSMYNTIKRVQKPFKNLEQSTYELIHLEKGIRCIGEKVSSLRESLPGPNVCLASGYYVGSAVGSYLSLAEAESHLCAAAWSYFVS